MSRGFNFIVNMISVLLLLAIILAIVALFRKMISTGFTEIEGLDLNTIVLATAIVLSGLIIKSGWSISKMERQQAPEKVSAYQRFVDYFYAGLPADDGWHGLTAAMTLWASDNVLRQYMEVIGMIEEKQPVEDLKRKAEKVILDMRRDLGNSNLGILKGDIVKTEQRFEKYESETKTSKAAAV